MRRTTRRELLRVTFGVTSAVTFGVTSADWKRDRVRERLADGADLAATVHGMQTGVRPPAGRHARSGTFVDWLGE